MRSAAAAMWNRPHSVWGSSASAAACPAFEVGPQLVGAGLDRGDLVGERAVAEQDGGVGQPDGDLARVLEVHAQIDGAIEFGQSGVFGGWGELMGRAAGEAADHVNPVCGSLEEQHVTDLQGGVAARPVEELVAPPERAPHPLARCA